MIMREKGIRKGENKEFPFAVCCPLWGGGGGWELFVDVGARTGVDAGTWLGVGVGALLDVFFEGVGAGESTLNINILKKVSIMLSRITLIHT